MSCLPYLKRGGKKIEKEEDGVTFLVSLSILFIYGKKGWGKEMINH